MMQTMEDDRMNDTPTPPPEAFAGTTGETTATQPEAQGQRLRFNTANIKSTYCNVCNATSTREEVVVNFGLNQTWDLGTRDLDVALEHRIILSPAAAKRLHEMLGKLLQEHEARYGQLR